MRPALVVAVGTVTLAVAAAWALTTIVIAPHPQGVNAAPTSASIDTVPLMKNARNLPVQQFDAH
jgi:hypothetical protein